MSAATISIIVVVTIVVLFIWIISYIKAPPQIAYIISGLSKQPGKAAITDLVVKVLPDMARATAEPIKAIDNRSICASDGNGVTNVTNSVPVVLNQTFDVVKDATGVDMSEIIKNNQRIKIDDDSQVTVKK